MIYNKLSEAPANRPVCILTDGTCDVWMEGESQPVWYQAPIPAGVQEVTSWQLTQALIETDMITSVESLVSTTTDPLIKYGWAKATIYRRNDPVVVAAQKGLNLTDEQVDFLFSLASSK